ncbi:MAG: hypothetical protein QOG57_1694, partial [Pseudonocardiales bacterium]|nr:hypothetical protein [Pseudonocardiales bacterium]
MSDTEQGMANLDLLLTPAGAAVLDRLAGTELTAGVELRLAETLRREFPAELVTAALAQYELRQRARAKFTRAESMWLTRDGLEQASSEPIARHRATRYAGARRVADLCCGIGGDLVALAGVGAYASADTTASSPSDTTAAVELVAVDRDPLHLRMAT